MFCKTNKNPKFNNVLKWTSTSRLNLLFQNIQAAYVF